MVLTSSHSEFRFGPVLKDHVARIGNIWGTRRKARAVADTVRVIVTSGVGSLALNVFVINRRESQGSLLLAGPHHADVIPPASTPSTASTTTT